MVDTDNTRRMTYDRQPTMPGVWHKLPTGELTIPIWCKYLKGPLILRKNPNDKSNVFAEDPLEITLTENHQLIHYMTQNMLRDRQKDRAVPPSEITFPL